MLRGPFRSGPTMQTSVTKTSDWRFWLLSLVGVAAVAVTLLHGPIAQDQAYHHFADGRPMLGVANFWNVASNLPFLLCGAWGLVLLRSCPTGRLRQRSAYLAFFIASSLVAFGSAYYHAAPEDARLVWDRLPMSLAFMAFFAAIVDRHLRPGFAARALIPLLLTGLASVLWWRVSGDLRFYLLVQFLPILLIPLILLLFPSRAPGSGLVWVVLGVYALAKVLEIYDAEVYRALGISGHSLKHLAAAVGVGCVAGLVRAARTVPGP